MSSASPQTVTSAFRATVSARREEVAIKALDPPLSWTWGELERRADSVASTLRGLGVGRGESVAVLLTNRPEFHAADLGALLVGAVPFSPYNTLPPEDLAYVLRDAGARVVVTERALEPGLRAAIDKHAAPVDHILLVEDEALWQAPPGEEAAADPGDLATIIYTSGTTGPPKGVELTHANVLWMSRAIAANAGLGAGMEALDYLPAAHIAERLNSHYLALLLGMTVTCCPDAAAVAPHLAQVRPHFFFAPPRLWEKLRAAVASKLGPEADLGAAGPSVCEAVGFDRLVTAYVGAAPVPSDLVAFWRDLGVPLSAVYGLSECSGVATASPPRVRLGTVGTALPDVELRLEDDGEVLVRSPGVMTAYRGLPEETAAAIDPEGWLHTGDVGELDDDGYLRIVDRKKELIITAAGKNLSPANIEAKLKAGSLLIGQACAIGEGRPYVVALIVLDPDAAAAFAERRGLEANDIATLSQDQSVEAEVARGVEEANTHMARVEQIKRFAIVPEDWVPGGPHLTPTMKLKRQPIAESYGPTIETLYAGGSTDAAR
jgi:long-chain acyl-CoA synthetase